MVEFSVFKTLALIPLTGLLGIDYLALRSPFTAFLKLVVNLLFFGVWYFYDVVQVVTDPEFVAKYGLSRPWGLSGDGFRMFNNTLTVGGVATKHSNEFPKPSPYYGGPLGLFNYIAYVAMTPYLGFTGLNSALAGDWGGFGYKLATCLFLAPYYMISSILDYFNSGKIEKEGVPRPWPVQGLMNIMIFDNSSTYPAVNIISKELGDKQAKEHQAKVDAYRGKQDTETPPTTLWKTFYGYMTSIPRFINATATVSEATSKATTATGKGAEQTAKLLELQAKQKELELSQLQKAVASGKTIPTPPPTPPPTPVTQAGGALIRTDAENQWDTILLIGLGLFIFGGFAVTLVRKMTLPKRKDENEHPRKTYDGDDTPPNPGRV